MRAGAEGRLNLSDLWISQVSVQHIWTEDSERRSQVLTAKLVICTRRIKLNELFNYHWIRRRCLSYYRCPKSFFFCIFLRFFFLLFSLIIPLHLNQLLVSKTHPNEIRETEMKIKGEEPGFFNDVTLLKLCFTETMPRGKKKSSEFTQMWQTPRTPLDKRSFQLWMSIN